MFNDVMQKKTFTIGIRVDAELYERLQKTVAVTGIEPSSLGRSCLEALVGYIEREREITLPLAVVPQKELDRLYFEAQ
jgi:hypothetical protein